MEYKKKVMSIVRAILYPESTIVIVCKDEEESRKCFNELQYIIEQYDILKPEVEFDLDYVIRFKNGSNISVLKPNEKTDVVRGKRADISHWMFDFGSCNYLLTREQIDEVLKPFCKKVDKE